MGASMDNLTFVGDDLCAYQVVARHAVLATKPTHASSQDETRDARRQIDAMGMYHAVLFGFVIDITQGGTRSNANNPRDGIDKDVSPLTQVNHEMIVLNGLTGNVVSTTADANLELLLVTKLDAGDHVGVARALDNHAGLAINQAVPDLASVEIGRVVVCLVDDLAANRRFKGNQIFGRQSDKVTRPGLDGSGLGLHDEGMLVWWVC